jgi:YidC/Oxa1 family membrane protein insertase
MWHKLVTQAPLRLRILSLSQQKRGIGTVESALVAIHAYTHWPWFATIAASTLIVRLSLFPLVRAQIIESRKLAEAMPKIEYMTQLVRSKLKTRWDIFSSEKELRLLLKGSRAVFQFHEVSVLRLVAFPTVNIALFATFVFSLRDMIIGTQRADLATGGLWWFVDLISRDSTYILPMTAVGVSYVALDVAFSKTSDSRTLLFIKDTFQSILIVSIPIIVHMPSGLFFYWITSSMCGILQQLLLRDPRVMKALGIPIPLPNPNTIKQPKKPQ